ncbi:MAG: hypothetical protein ACR2PZ_11005 [Pseudomonadales bacterium]
MIRALFTLLLAVTSAACAPKPVVDEAALERIRNALVQADRIEWDKPFDASRQPVEYMRFFGVATGMTVLDLGAAAGYTTEIMAAAVGPQGRVYAQIDDQVLRLQNGFYERTLQKRIGPDGSRRSNIQWWHHELNDLELSDLDLVHWGFNLHDHYHSRGEDYVQEILQGVHLALKPMGILAVSDHIGIAGNDNRKLHRITVDELRNQLEKAGFRIEEQSPLLANPNDDHSLNVFADEIYRKTDRVLIRAVKI